jgi:two-component sensor histidine kinase
MHIHRAGESVAPARQSVKFMLHAGRSSVNRMILAQNHLARAACRTVLSLLFVLSAIPAVFGSPVVLDKATSSLNVSRNLECLEDRFHALTIEQVADPAAARPWRANDRDYINFGYTPSAYWFRLVLSNPRGITDRLMLEIDRVGLEHVDLFSPDGTGVYRATRTGNSHPFSSRVIQDRNYIFPLQIQNGNMVYFLRISTNVSFRFRANLYFGNALIESRNRYNSFIWFVYGMVLLTGVFYLFLFAFLRDRVYLYFSVSVFFMLFHQIFFRGFAFQFLWPLYPRLGIILYPLTISAMGIFLTLFIREILDTRTTSRTFDLLFTILAIIVFPASALSSFVAPYRYVLQADYYLSTVGLVIIIVAAIYYLGRGNRFAWYLLAGIVGIMTTMVLTVFTALGNLPATSSIEWSIEVGLLLLVLFSSLGLVDRFWNINRALVNSERCLQDKNVVLTRTNEDLRQSLAEKIALIREVHDRVKNNMQVVSSMLNLQVHNLSNPETARVLTDAVARIHSMASIHERIYQAENFTKVDMGSYLAGLAHYLVAQYAEAAAGTEPVRVVSRISPVFLPVDRAVPSGLLISELLTNAIKHGCRGSADPVVELSMECVAGSLTLTIADNGPGMDRELIQGGDHGTIGMQIIYALSRQVGAIIDLDTGRGTRVTVRVAGCDVGM